MPKTLTEFVDATSACTLWSFTPVQVLVEDSFLEATSITSAISAKVG